MTGRRDALLAVRNGLKLFAAMLATGGIGLVLRLFIPAALGPTLFGPLTYAEAFTAMYVVTLSLGTDTYARREGAVEPGRASEYLGGIILARAGLAVPVFGAMWLVLDATGATPLTRTLVAIVAVAQMAMLMSQLFAAMLQAKGTVDGLSVVNVGSKLAWAASVLLALLSEHKVIGVALALLLSEVLRLAALAVLAWRTLELRFRVRWTPLKHAVMAGLPFYLNEISVTVYNKLDVNALEWTAHATLSPAAANREVGYYGAATRIGDLTLYLTPIVFSVLMPLLARAAHRSQEEYTRLLRRSLELILVVAIPIALAVALGADVWTQAIFGRDFAPAAGALRLLAPLFVLTYVAVVTSVALATNERPWSILAISLIGLGVNGALNATIIRPSIEAFGEGGGGIGGALAQVGTEGIVTALLLALIGRRALDQRTLKLLGKTAIVCAAVFALDASLTSWGAWRLVADALAYASLVLLLRAVPFRDGLALLREARAARHDAG